MARLVLTNSKLGPEHYRAICGEIGERLRSVLRPETDFPLKIVQLLDLLATTNCEGPSIAPTLGEMTDATFMDVI